MKLVASRIMYYSVHFKASTAKFEFLCAGQKDVSRYGEKLPSPWPISYVRYSFTWRERRFGKPKYDIIHGELKFSEIQFCNYATMRTSRKTDIDYHQSVEQMSVS